MRVLELGSYIVPAYAGMILREQRHHVTKWTSTRPDPVFDLHRGVELWAWLNTGKRVLSRAAVNVAGVQPGEYDIIVDNIRGSTWQRWGVDPAEQATRIGCRWVSMRDDLQPDGRSFDAIAQARAWGDHLGYLPAYLGDTIGGLWLAFKALAAPPGHHVVHQAAALAKVIEGELMIDIDRSGATPPWDQDRYGPDGDGVTVVYRGQTIHEPYRDQQWRRTHLRHHGGRLAI